GCKAQLGRGLLLRNGHSNRMGQIRGQAGGSSVAISASC
ncbi:RNA recognition motif-containing protein, partial [Toxoplasma gondii RUB]